MSRTSRTALAALVATSVLLAACGGDEPSATETTPAAAPTSDAPSETAIETEAGEETPTPTEEATETADGIVITLTVSGGTVSGADSRVEVPLGEEVTLVVTADGDDEIHVHGYDHQQQVVAGEEAALTFTADIPGVFEVELEESGVKLVELEVR